MNLLSFSKIFTKRESKIELAKKRSEEAFISLIDENMTSFYRVAKGILSSDQDIQDGIQNTILIIYNKIHTLKDNNFFKTWAIRILINECTKIYNNNKKIVLRDSFPTEISYTENIDSNIDLYDALSTLSDDLRLPTILFYFDNFSYKQISEIINVPEGTVKSRIFRSKEKLYTILKDKED